MTAITQRLKKTAIHLRLPIAAATLFASIAVPLLKLCEELLPNVPSWVWFFWAAAGAVALGSLVDCYESSHARAREAIEGAARLIAWMSEPDARTAPSARPSPSPFTNITPDVIHSIDDRLGDLAHGSGLEVLQEFHDLACDWRDLLDETTGPDTLVLTVAHKPRDYWRRSTGD